MGGVIPRLLGALVALLAGGLVGWAVGAPGHAAGRGALAGALAGVLVHGVVDAWRAHRFMRWLRGGLAGTAPRDAGFWGEVGYRVERALRAEQREVQAERDRRQDFLSAIEAAPSGVLLLDAADRLEWCNSVAADHFGLDPRRDLQQRLTNLVRAPAFVAHLQDDAADGPVSFPRPGGGGTLSVTVRRYGAGRKLVLSQDVTERERHDAMRRDFVANVSHEIRTPLTVLSGFLETLGSLPLSPPERQRIHGLMAQQAARMQTLVGDLLTLAELEGRPRPGTDGWVSLDAVVAKVHADAEALSAGRHDIAVPPRTGVELAGAEAELRSALANLLQNAVRYTPEGGRIDVRWSLREDGTGVLDVTDTGIGIAREHLPRLTERFYRVDGSRSRDTGGTGLGLSIVKHVVQRHGGELEIVSEPGRGSTFRIVVPPVRVRGAEPAPTARRTDPVAG